MGKAISGSLCGAGTNSVPLHSKLWAQHMFINLISLFFLKLFENYTKMVYILLLAASN